MSPTITAIAYLIAGSLFIIGIRGLTHPKSAPNGNRLAMTAMGIGIGTTLTHQSIENYSLIIAAIVIGAPIGWLIGKRVSMTAMPQLVALLHSFVGLCAVLVAFGIYLIYGDELGINRIFLLELCIGIAVGSITCTGSLVAFAKLQGLISGRPLRIGGRHTINIVLTGICLGFGSHFLSSGSLTSLLILTVSAFVLGVLLILPIGGVDMPVIVSMLNSYSGWAAAATGFTLNLPILIITGALVGFSGAILSFIMCRAMNRSFLSVLFGGFGKDADAPQDSITHRPIQQYSVEDAVFMLVNADRVVIVPGYGMAVAQAQHSLNELICEIDKRDIDIKCAIHPVAGRMPGHMNVLLAEADVPYEKVIEMDEINPEFSNADVAVVIGANDVTNPAAQNDPASPIFGMPILEVHKARHVIFIKRSMSPGYSGVDNDLFYRDNCALVFGDAKEVCDTMIAEIKSS